ncbi:O-acetyl-ADP-ribose deacetylase [Sinomicrobium weinanense]|uniref:O-acetyl-ADP-ribose deacetylase n=1 Tax=Sinomicrobium weinanense TaxID=2842200 RepID=A0A926Q1T8_9FLAO|nr:O-acetyl-ADP-ribose deacetylase [Sinomicrobium weinanense]MBC9796012.1 O-acetyl-ADP-ribose deacetylase [Sinomicrobium weinanense]MBU3123169.1 O-acetyl-ADP-ribose deacetylase [Sinomicrobium weinanense]
MIQIIKGDITQIKADAIVNAANNSLMGGGGVDGAIHKAGGPAILEDCKKILARQGGCRTGEAVITTAGNLPAGYVIHTVGPVWNGGKNGEPELLYHCYQNALKLARDHQCKTIAFPNISTGVYRFPKPLAAETAHRSIRDFLESSEHRISEVIIVCFDDENYQINREIV